jgi:signal transduction histidine kinase
MMQRSTDRQTAALVEAGMVLASELDLPALLQRIADLSREIVGARYGAVGVIGEEGELGQFVYSGIDDETAQRIGDLPRGRGVLGALLEEQRPLRLREISDHRSSYGFPEHHPEMHTFLGVPIVVRGRAYGRLYLTEKRGAAEFTKDDERIALTFAAQAGVAIDNARLYEEVRTRGEVLARLVSELASVEQVSGLLLAGTTIEETIRSTGLEAMKLSGATKCLVALQDKATGEMVIKGAVGNVHPSIVGRHLPPQSSKSEAVMRRMEAEVVEDLSTDPEMSAETMKILDNPGTGAFVPLSLRLEGVGALAVYDRVDGSPFSQDSLLVLQVLANQLAIALENERLTEALKDYAILEERERISSELHDGVIQSIYSVGLSLQGSMSLLARDPDQARKRIDGVIAELDNVVRDVRSYIFELRPKTVEEKGLEEAIADLLKDLEVNTLAATEVSIDQNVSGSFSENEQSQVIQVVREILSNIARHAQAEHVSLVCRREGDEAVIEILDDGEGFDPESVTRGHGLRNMTSRAARLGGRLEIKPLDSGGMQHTLRFPKDGDR